MDHFVASAAVAYACALVGGLLLRNGREFANYVCIATIGVIILTPVMVPADRTILRGFAAFFATDLSFKIIDYLRHTRSSRHDAGSFADLLRFLVPFPVFLAVLEQRNRRPKEPPHYWLELGNIALGAGGFAVGSTLMYLANQSVLLQTHFAIDHLVKLAIVVVLVESASWFMHHLELLAGYDTLPPMLNIVASRTVGEFWCRWNTRVHTWLQYNVFIPIGGRRAPIRGVLHCFFWSAVLHEVAFGIATSRFDGYQFAFFMLQIPPVLLSRRMQRFGLRHGIAGKALLHLFTISWISLSSILFFQAIDRVFPFFYVSKPWLP